MPFLLIQPDAPVDADPIDTLSGAILLFVAVGVIAVVLIAIARNHERAVPLGQALTTPAAICALGASVIHYAVAPVHFSEYAAFGLAFFLLATVQGLWALAWRFGGKGTALGLVGWVINAGAIFVWAWSRTAGLPFGPSAGTPESVGGADLAAVAFESVLVTMLTLETWPRTRHGLLERRITWAGAVQVRSVAASAVGVLTLLAVAGGHGHG